MTLKTTILQAGRRAAQSQTVRKVAKTARVVVQSGPVTEVARLCGRAGVAGAIVDGSMGGMQAVKAVRDGKLDKAGAAKHVAAEAGCGFVTSSAGTAGTVAVYLVTGTMGPAALVAGMGASMGSRWVYRKFVGETLPDRAATAPPEQPANTAKPEKKEEPQAPKVETAKPETAAKTAPAKPEQTPPTTSSAFEAIGPDSDD